jgi:hypothetical protein
MLRPFGSACCPRCDANLISTGAVRERAGSYEDSYLLCPSCGYSRAVVYAVERATRRPTVFNRFTRLWQSF